MDFLLLEELGRERAPEQVTNRLREAIVSGLLQPGDRLMQEELAERLGVSRMPVREALRRLEAEGLVVLQPYRGALVANLSSTELQELYELRIALETLALGFGIPEMDAKSFEAMEVTLAQMNLETDSATWLDLNAKFHTLLYKNAGRQLLHEHIENLRNKSDRFLRLFASHRDRTAHAQREHWAILHACQERETEQACNLLRDHLQSTVDSLAGTLRMQEEKTQPPSQRKKE